MGKIKKFSLTVLFFLVIGTSVFGNFVLVEPANAQALAPVTIGVDLPRIAEWIKNNIAEVLTAAIINAGVKAASYALRRVAYDTAVWIAAGGKGQSPLAYTSGFGSYLGSVANDAAGTAIQSLGQPYGLNLCKIPDIKVDLAMRIGLRNQFGVPPKPACNFTSFLKNWKDGFSKFSGGSIIKNFNASLTVSSDSDFGIYLDAVEKINNKVVSQSTNALADRQEGGGYKPLTSQVNGQVLTPASTVKKNAESTLTPDQIAAKNENEFNAAIANGDVKVFPAILGLFLNTLGSNIVSNFQTKGILPFGACVGGMGGDGCKKGLTDDVSSASDLTFDSMGVATLGRAAAQNFFSYLTTVKLAETNNYDLVAQLTSCPDDGRGIYNCRMGDDLSNAVSQQMTIGEAIKKGILDGNRKLISPTSASQAAKNTDINCYQDSYCLSNVKVLRQVRILPLGFEIAVQNSDETKPWTLSQVVNGFNDSTSQFYHLIDPDWVLKAPAAKCNALGFGPTLLSSDVPERLQDCVDLQSCVSYNANGTCNDYAYCTREKNSWKFPADSCDSQYATCQSFQNSKGQNVSYLYRTLDTGFCNANNTGCTAYSLSQVAGAWDDPAFNATTGKNSGIFLNNKAGSGCSANSAGCSAFTVASSTSDTVYLKKAPDYLHCYDTNQATAVVDWPQYAADLGRTNGFSPECKKYSGACIADEASCNWYTPTDGGGPRIPGKFKPAEIVNNQIVWNDQCDAKCVGYDSYLEMPSNYSAGNNLSYIIPASGKACSAADEGCTAFTNLGPSGGTEYFSYLRLCQKPSEVTGSSKTFVTYEGTKDAGFQLKTFVLVTEADGSPKLLYNPGETPASLNCTPAAYQAGTADPDCRQFIDPSIQNGQNYYGLMARTVVVDDSCTAYRLDNPELLAANTCYQFGTYKGGACLYEGLPGATFSNAGTSHSCSAAVNTCRAYKGNTGNNIQIIANDTFESNSTTGWSGGVIAPVSTHSGEHSLSFTANASRQITLEPQKGYDLTFWAVGNGGRVDVSIVDVNNNVTAVGSFTVGDVWRAYHLGPANYTGTAVSGTLRFALTQGGGTVYIDNLRLVKVTDLLYLVKNSLSVDPVCDSNLTDNLPGEALGCKAYTDPQNRSYDLTNFSFLCREDAIGCTALFDTFNTANTAPAAYNVWLSATSTGATAQRVTATVGADNYSCDIVSGQGGCYINIPGHSIAEIQQSIPDGLVNSTQFVPGKSTSTPAIYLVANQAATCDSQDLGCTIAGIQKLTPNGVDYVTTTIKNLPDQYSQTLCQSEAVGCDAFSMGGADVRYFKDPNVLGDRTCAYRTNVTYGTSTVSGWFWQDPIGNCSNDTTSTNFCTVGTAAADCGTGNTCVNTDNEPCYPDYLVNGDTFGMWSYGNSDQYLNFVGACPAAQSQCTEFVDHADSDKSYYLVKDDKLTSGDCNGQVSQKGGCALFDEVDNPAKTWQTTSTYALSNSQDGILVPPVSNNQNDANSIFKVVKDRDCGEWLECGSSYSVFDQQQNKYKSVCLGLQRCTGADDCGGQITSGFGNNLLTKDVYQGRVVGWEGMDYAGYSLLNFYPLEEYAQVNVNTSKIATSTPDWRLVEKIPCGNNCSPRAVDFATCNDVNPVCGTGAMPGKCINHECLRSVNDQDVSLAPGQICRAYPEKDAPFPSTNRTKTAPAFKTAHLCDETDSSGCECNYKKVDYGDGTEKYYNYFKPTSQMPAGICMAGTKDGQVCNTDADCKDGTCQQRGTSRAFLGWKGFCLESDPTRHLNSEENLNQCMTWFPIESLNGAMDIYNQHTEAGSDWHSTASGQYYCLNSSGSTSTPSFILGFSAAGLRTPASQVMFGVPDDGYGPPDGVDDDQRIFKFDRAHLNVGSGLVGINSLHSLDAASSFNPALFSGVRKEDIDWIEFRVTSTHGWDNLNSGQTFYVFPNDYTNSSAPQSVYIGLHNINSNRTTNAAAGFYRNDPNQIIVFANTEIEKGVKASLDDTGYFKLTATNDDWNCGPNGSFTGLNGNLFQSSGLSAGSFATDIWNSSFPNTYDFTLKRGFFPMYCKHSENSGGTFNGVMLSFDPRSHLFTGIDTVFGNANYGIPGDQTGFDGDPYDVTYEVIFKLRKWCPYVADANIDLASDDTSGNRTIVQTNRLWSVPNGWNNPFTTRGFAYRYNTANPAFGSIGSIFDQNTAAVIAEQTWKNPPCVKGVSASGTSGSFCTFDVAARNSALGGQGYSNSVGGLNQAGVDYLSELFASVAGDYRYDLQAGSYVQELVPYPGSNITQTGGTYGQIPVPPEVHPVGICGTGKSKGVTGCEEPPELGITINSNNTTFVTPSSSIKASMDFYMFADPNQMPLREVTLDWGTGLDANPIIGFFRNQRGLISGSPQCFDLTSPSTTDYGLIRDQTCDNAYFHAEGSYYCKDKTDTNWENTGRCLADAGVAANGETFPHGCCVYEPRVRLKDNWGWCNGTCPDGRGGERNGCYDDVANGVDQCAGGASNDPWTYMMGSGGAANHGKVIVPAAQ